MATFEFKLPDIGEGVVEGEIVKWLIKEGEEIAEDQPMVEVMTDKATVTIPSPRKGKVLKLHVEEGTIAKVHHDLVTLEVEGEGAAPSAPAPAAAASAPAAAAQPQAAAAPAPSAQKVLATPVTRRMAREHGINLAEVTGTGPSGRVLKADLEALIAGGARPEVNRLREIPSAPVASFAGDQRVPLKGLRKAIAKKMVQSKFTAPHFTFVEECDATELKALRKRLNDRLAAGGDTLKLSFLPFIFKAIVAGMRKFPTVNANFDDASQELILRGSYNFGMAVATDDGLTVPVIKNVESKSLRELADEIASLAAAAREKRLRQEDLSGGSFTVTSLGQTGGLFATPIINYPEVAILGVHRMREVPVVRDGQITVRDVMYLSLSFDHRVIDGAVGAAFTYEVIRYLENPELLMLELA